MDGDEELKKPDVVDKDQLARIESTHRGFLYQHLYTAAVLLNAERHGVVSVLVESDEDLEILFSHSRTYVQVKFRQGVLGLPDIEEALVRFSQYRALHEAGERAGAARFVIASSATPRPKLLEMMSGTDWPSDVSIEWPNGPSPHQGILAAPMPSILEMAEYTKALAAQVPFALLAPETLVWKLAGLITLAASGQAPRANHRFTADELPNIFEQLIKQLQDFPAPPSHYRTQEGEPSLLSSEPARLVTGYSGAGKTSWAAQAAVHSLATFVYFDVRDIPGGGLASALARELAARLYQTEDGMSAVLLPGASGLEILQSIAREWDGSDEPITVVIDNAHSPVPSDVADLVRAARGIQFLLLAQPGAHTHELATVLQIEQETLKGWSRDTIAAEAAGMGCVVTVTSSQMLLDLTGGLPLYVQNAIQVSVMDHAGDLAKFCNELKELTHSVETAQEIILTRVIDKLPENTQSLLAILSLSDIPLSRAEMGLFALEAIGEGKQTVSLSLRRLRTNGLIQGFGGDGLKVHDAARVVGMAKLAELGEQKALQARQVLLGVLSDSISAEREYRKFVLYIRLLAEVGDIRMLVDFGTDEWFHEMGFWPIIEPYLVKAAYSEQTDPKARFAALDGIVFNEMRRDIGDPGRHIAMMNQFIKDHQLGVDEKLDVGMKEMNFLAKRGDGAGARLLMERVANELHDTPVHKRIFRYNAACAMYLLEEYGTAETEVSDLIKEYYDLFEITPEMVSGRNPPELYPLIRLRDDIDEDFKRVADCLDLHAKIARAQDLLSPLASVHAMKFYTLASAPESLIRVGQDLADDFMTQREYIHARAVFEENLFPTLNELQLVNYLIPVRSHYAVVLAYCGDIPKAEAEMDRLAPYEAGLSEQGRAELRKQRGIIALLKVEGPPAQFEVPAFFMRYSESLREELSDDAVDPRPEEPRRIDPCPCGSGKRYKHCHGAFA
ncbi:hypothetical protein ASD46_18650 [Rhizobium sp. Root491]|uniref:SEC-C metal-binding domain-containing protein n=1 Tax=Rhizobium sp. Root491 TaxID=1736548 RepID=UPI000713ACB4|nr:SEC-C metal-binding domain-containing protein [Rhizobium sp. Root491]KQY41336.1 hypothetical protein ASD46_18650 [Rhizobium sp. Root491]